MAMHQIVVSNKHATPTEANRFFVITQGGMQIRIPFLFVADAPQLFETTGFSGLDQG